MKSNHHPSQTTGKAITRREFIPRIATAALGAGALLNPGTLLGRNLGTSAATSLGPMKYRMLGQTGISVSEVSFGSHLNKQNMSNPQARAEQIRKGLELGINLFDIYEHSYQQFEPMSKVLGPVRQDVVLSLVTVWSRNQTMQEVEFALKTFNTDVIDLYRIYYEPTMSRDEIDVRFEVLQQAKQEGKIRAAGLVTHDHAVLVDVLQAYPELDYLMLPYNFRHQRYAPATAVQPASWGQIKAGEATPSSPKAVVEDPPDCMYYACQDSELLPLVRETGVGLLAIKPFAGGGLLNLLSSDPLLEKLKDAEVSLPQAALRFVLDAPEIASTIPAMNSLDEVEENAGAVQGDGFSAADIHGLQLWAETAEQARGAYLPQKYKWLEEWKA